MSPTPEEHGDDAMTTLYYSPGAASLVVHWLLLELDMPHALVELDFAAKAQKSAEYLRLNPSGVVPTLVLDGRPLTEAAAIVLHLADLHPDAGLAPVVGMPGRADYYRWMFYLANMLQPAFRAWYYPEEFAGPDNVPLVKARAEKRAEACFDLLDAHLAANGPCLLGERPSAADFYLTMLMRWSRNLPKQALDWPALRALADAMRARPSFARLYAAEGLSEWAPGA
jgi:glutathione S-transferase